MESILRSVELIEAQSAFSQHRCAPAAIERRLKMTSYRIGQTTLVLTRNSQNAYYNRWIAAGIAGPATESQLDDVIERAREHGCRVLTVPVGALAQPACLTEWLEARMFTSVHPTAKLWRAGTPLHRAAAPKGIRVLKVGTAHRSKWVDVVSQVWRSYGSRRAWYEARASAPGWQHFIAWQGDEAVGAGALFTADTTEGRAGHLVDGVTLKPYRRRGVQGALIRKRISAARRLGCTALTSETAPPRPRMPLVSYRNLKRQGFALSCTRKNWRLDLR